MMGFSKRDIQRQERTLAGRTFKVAITPRLKAGRLEALKGLAKGMGLTLDYLTHPSRIVTSEYPENRKTLKLPERFRAMLRMPRDENGYHRCTGCKICQKACPNASITVLTRKGPVSGKMEVDRHIWRQDSCVMCNACVLACPFGALEMTGEFENVVYDRRLLVYTINPYAGPPAPALAKVEDAQLRQQMMEPRDRYGGPVPMNGHGLPNLRPLGVAGVSPASGTAVPVVNIPVAAKGEGA
jgi:NADH-quinone oxidoreductase subunit I